MRLDIALASLPILDFYPRTPAGCDPNGTFSHLLKKFLSTHPCGVRPLMQLLITISISHFYPRTPAGCDIPLPYFLRSRFIFLSTHPCGVRRFGSLEHQTAFEISIHAPLRGATNYQVSPFKSPLNFYPRTPAGCDIYVDKSTGEQKVISIHAPLRGAT